VSVLVDLAELLSRALRQLLVDRLEGVGAGLADLRTDVLHLGHVEVLGRLRVAHRELVERADTMAEPLAGDEDRRADVEAKRVVLERRSVPVAHEEADQALVRLVHLLLAAREADTRGVDDREIGRHRAVEPDEAVVEDADRVVSYDSLGRGHSRIESSRGACRHLRLVLSLLEAGFLPGGDRLEGVPQLLRAAFHDRRAEHDRLPTAGRGAVHALGRADAARLHLRTETGGEPPADRRGGRRTRPAAR